MDEIYQVALSATFHSKQPTICSVKQTVSGNLRTEHRRKKGKNEENLIKREIKFDEPVSWDETSVTVMVDELTKALI